MLCTFRSDREGAQVGDLGRDAGNDVPVPEAIVDPGKRQAVTMEIQRFRLRSTALAASFCMFVVGIVCAPMMDRFHWAVYPTMAVMLVAFYLMWRAVRTWRELEVEYERGSRGDTG